MFQFTAALRLAIGLAFLGISVFLASRTMGLGEDEWTVATNGRAALAETIAIHASSQVAQGTVSDLERQLNVIVDRNEDLISLGLRRNGKLVVEAGGHDEHWIGGEVGIDSQMYVPITVKKQDWGELQICFKRLRATGIWQYLTSRGFYQLLFVTSAATLLYTIYLRQMLNHLDPSRVIPDRVRAALDTFAEGLLVIDRNSRIVLANKSFAETIGSQNDDLQGKNVADFPWITGAADFPWADALQDGAAHTGRMIDLMVTDHQKITYMVNASPIFSDKGALQGVLASFDDVTLHEQRKQELERTLRVLGESREQIRKQNAELRILATRDPLTGCLNRRAFFDQVTKVWENANVSGQSVACIMVDVDHFKSVNDNHGHSVGDEVLRCVGKTLVALEAACAIPCRYGGEEFAVLVEGRDEDQAREFAEEIRSILEASRPGGISITASFGVAVRQHASDSFESILDRADQSLYVAKRRGRNRVVCSNDFGQDEFLNGEGIAATTGELRTARERQKSDIPFHAVTALISALTCRDAATAEHSRRVADLCVRLGNKFMSVRDQYVLETAALLHDIGKIGTPDVVLLKPGPLDSDELDVMSQHDVIGAEIVRTTFDNQDLVDIVSNHYAWYGGHPLLSKLPVGDDIPVGARVLAICDSYDAIVNDRVYRKGTNPEQAFAELRRFAGTQFDPSLVELFIEAMNEEGVDLQQISDVSKDVALRIGLVMEEITNAMEAGDTSEIQYQAKLLSVAATESKLEQVAKVADELAEISVDDAEVEDLIEIATTLLDLCRITQRAYLGVGEASRGRRESFAKRPFGES